MSRLESLLMNLMWHGSWRSRVMEVFPVIRWVSVMLVNSEDWPPKKKKTKTKTRFNLTHRHEHRHTDEQTRVTVGDSPVHGAALSPFSLEDQIPPDQLRDREKTEVKMSEIKPNPSCEFVLTWCGDSHFISDSVFPSLVLLLVERIRWGTETGDWQGRDTKTVKKLWKHEVFMHFTDVKYQLLRFSVRTNTTFFETVDIKPRVKGFSADEPDLCHMHKMQTHLQFHTHCSHHAFIQYAVIKKNIFTSSCINSYY